MIALQRKENSGTALGVATATIALLLIAGCDNPVTQYLPASQSDSAGITIVGNAQQAEDSTSWWIDSIASVVIGDETKGAPYIFSWIADVELLSDNNIVVADGTANEVRHFDSRGTFIRNVGRRGDGPGEFRGAHHLHLLPGDTLIVASGYTGSKAVVFAPDGKHVRTIAPPEFRADSLLLRRYQAPTFVGFFSDGSSLASSSRSRTGPLAGSAQPGKAALVEDSSRFFRGVPGGLALADSGDQVSARYYRYHNPDPRGSGFIFDNAVVVAKIHRAIFQTKLYLSDGQTFEVRQYSPEQREMRTVQGSGASLPADARLVRIIRKDATPVPLSRKFVDSLWSTQVAGFDRYAELHWLRTAEPPPVPESAPVIDQLLVDPTGNIWVRSGWSNHGGDPVWYVFDTNGVLRHSLKWKGDIRRIGLTQVLGIRRDSLGTAQVTVHKLNKNGPR